MLPRLIHQTVNNLQPILQKNIERLKELNSGWTHHLYTDKDINQFLTGENLSYYNRINPIYGAARADFFRYVLMYELGGVYLDIKSTAIKPLNSVIKKDDTYILSHWSNNWGKYPELGVVDEYQQWHIVATPRHPYLKAVIEKVKQNIDSYDPKHVGKMGVLRVTGPIAYTLAIYNVRVACRLATNEEMGFQYSIFKDPSTHKKDKNHYSRLTSPVIINKGV